MKEPKQLSFFCAGKKESAGTGWLKVAKEVNCLFPYLQGFKPEKSSFDF